MGIDEKDRELIHANDVLAKQFCQLPPHKRLRLSPIVPAEGCRAIAEIKEHLVLPPVTFAQPAAGPVHQGSLVIEVLSHEFLEPSNKELESKLVAVHCAEPAIGDGHVVGIDHIVTEPELFPDQ